MDRRESARRWQGGTHIPKLGVDRPLTGSASDARCAGCAARAARTSVLGRTFAEWIKLESEHRWTVKDYLARLNGGCFGGVLEIAMCSVSRELCIDVWRESSHGRLVLVAAFGHADGRSSRLVLNLLHMQGRRYAALLGLQSRRLRT